MSVDVAVLVAAEFNSECVCGCLAGICRHCPLLLRGVACVRNSLSAETIRMATAAVYDGCLLFWSSSQEIDFPGSRLCLATATYYGGIATSMSEKLETTPGSSVQANTTPRAATWELHLPSAVCSLPVPSWCAHAFWACHCWSLRCGWGRNVTCLTGS